MTIAPGTRDRALAALADLGSLGELEPNEFIVEVARRPVLLRDRVIVDLLEHEIGKDHRLFDTLAAADYVRANLLPPNYPLGVGPVEQVWANLESGKISPSQASAAMVQLPLTESLMSLYVIALFFWLADDTVAGEWRRSRQRGDLLVQALDACAHRDDRAMRRARLLGTARWAHFLIIEVPERRILDLGDAAGRALLADAEELGDQDEIRHAAYELGGLWGDPFTSGKTGPNFDLEMQDWIHRAERELGQRDGPRDYDRLRLPPAQIMRIQRRRRRSNWQRRASLAERR
jgi:hypothetical protein